MTFDRASIEERIAYLEDHRGPDSTYTAACLRHALAEIDRLANERDALSSKAAGYEYDLTIERQTWCDKSEDRLYHASDGTWWKRAENGWCVSADAPECVANLRRFAQNVMGDNADEWGENQDVAEDCGLLVGVEAYEPCEAPCLCAEYGDFPTTCYRKTALLTGVADVNDEIMRISTKFMEDLCND